MHKQYSSVKFEPMSIATEFIIPILVQVTVITALLVISYGETLHSLSVAVISLLWLKSTYKKEVQEFGELRMARRLFTVIGSWINNNDAEATYDQAVKDYLLIAPGIEHESNIALITAWGMANGVRGMIAVVLQLYMLYVIAVVLITW